jgi:hypothetical protein
MGIASDLLMYAQETRLPGIFSLLDFGLGFREVPVAWRFGSTF